MHACTDRHHCLSNTVSLRTEEPISAAGQSNWQLCYGPSGWIHLDSTDEAKKKPVPNCTPISSSAQQEAIANQMLINWKQALDLEKPFSVLRKTMCWACQLFYQLLEKQNLHFPVLLLQTTSGFALLKQYSADQVLASITLLLRARRAQSLYFVSSELTEVFYSTFSRPLILLFPGRIPTMLTLGPPAQQDPFYYLHRLQRRCSAVSKSGFLVTLLIAQRSW